MYDKDKRYVTDIGVSWDKAGKLKVKSGAEGVKRLSGYQKMLTESPPSTSSQYFDDRMKNLILNFNDKAISVYDMMETVRLEALSIPYTADGIVMSFSKTMISHGVRYSVTGVLLLQFKVWYSCYRFITFLYLTGRCDVNQYFDSNGSCQECSRGMYSDGQDTVCKQCAEDPTNLLCIGISISRDISTITSASYILYRALSMVCMECDEGHIYISR